MSYTPLGKIQGLLPGDRTALGNHGFSSAEQIWEGLANNSGLVDSLGLPDAAAKARVIAALAALAKQESESLTRNKIRAHVPDLIALMLVGLVAGAVKFVDRNPRVVAVKPLAPFHVIDAGDVAVLDTADDAKTKQTLNAFVGRYPVEQIALGEIPDSAKLSSGMRMSTELNGLHIFSVKIRPTSILTGVKPPVKLGLYLSTRAKEDEGNAQLFDVYVLDFKPDGDSFSLVVAARDGDSRKLLSELSSADVVAVGPVR